MQRSALAVALLCGSTALGAEPAVSDQKFRHAKHEAAGLQLTCSGCHPSSPDGRLSFPGSNDHKPCANAACHADEFRKKDSKLCLGCHEHSDPYRPNPPKLSFEAVSEFVSGFSHKTHLEKKVFKAKGEACESCHSMGPQVATPAVLADQHRFCGSCHEALSKPSMLECAGCHMFGMSESAGGDWRVSERFSHTTHPGKCTECHDKVAASEEVPPPRPTKAQCAGCHDGKRSFKVTGFSCAKCHAPA
jgi:hypothetical protein